MSCTLLLLSLLLLPLPPLQGLQQRISVPDQLACLLGRALAELLPPLAHEPAPPATPSQKAKQRKCWEVDFVEQVRQLHAADESMDALPSLVLLPGMLPPSSTAVLSCSCASIRSRCVCHGACAGFCGGDSGW